MHSLLPTRPAPRPLPPRARFIPLLLATAGLVLVACRDSTAPGDGGPLPNDREVGGSLSESDTVDRYTFHGDSGAEIVFSIQAVSGQFEMRLTRDADTTWTLAWAAASSDGLALGLAPQRSSLVTLPASGTYRITVRKYETQPAGADGRYRLTRWALDRRPERAPQRVTIGDTVASEQIDRPLDVDEFIFHGEQGQVIQTFFQALASLGPAASKTFPLRLEIEGPEPSDVSLRAMLSFAGQAELGSRATGPVVLPATGDYRLRVRQPDGLGPVFDYVGAYRFLILAVDARPEHRAAAIAVGDTIAGESIDYPGDVDEFTFTVGPSSPRDYNVFFQALGEGSDVLTLEAVAVGAPVATTVAAARAPRGTPLLERGTGRFRVADQGTYTIRVTGEESRIDGGRGAYRLVVAPIERRPESVAATLAPGDSVLAESLDIPGDIDEFTVTLAQRTQVNLALWRTGTRTPAEGLYAELVPHVGPDVKTVAVPPVTTAGATPVPGLGSGATELNAGTYTVRVSSTGVRPYAYMGSYKLQLALVPAPAPERAPAAVAVGQTVDEALDALGDADVFTFSGRRGEHLDLLVRGPGGADTGSFTFAVTGASDAYRGPVASVAAPLATTVLGAARTARFTLPATGSYEIRVASAGGGRNVSERGSYQLQLIAAPTNVETAASTLAVGGSVTTERIDVGGDVDEFTIQGAPGSEALVTVAVPSINPQTPGPRLRLDALDPATREPLPVAYIYGFQGVNDANIRFTLPASGRAVVQVYEPRPCVPEIEFCGGFYATMGTGAYTLRTEAVNRAPESVGATVAVGDTLRGEAVGYIADVDEFTLTGGTAGQRVILYFSTSGSTYGALTARLIDPATGATLGSLSAQDAQPLGVRATAPITLPRTGAYLLRVDAGATMGTSGYQVLVKEAP